MGEANGSQRFSQGDLTVEEMWERYGGLVLRRCRQLLGNEDDAMDVSQDVFLQVVRRRNGRGIEFPSSYLYHAATNLSLNRIRDARRRESATYDSRLVEIAKVEDSSGTVEARSILGRIFALQRPSSRLIAVLHFVDGLTLEQVAREVGMSVSGVRKRIRALRQTLIELEVA